MRDEPASTRRSSQTESPKRSSEPASRDNKQVRLEDATPQEIAALQERKVTQIRAEIENLERKLVEARELLEQWKNLKG